jgi:hypothetical protein
MLNLKSKIDALPPNLKALYQEVSSMPFEYTLLSAVIKDESQAKFESFKAYLDKWCFNPQVFEDKELKKFANLMTLFRKTLRGNAFDSFAIVKIRNRALPFLVDMLDKVKQIRPYWAQAGLEKTLLTILVYSTSSKRVEYTDTCFTARYLPRINHEDPLYDSLERVNEYDLNLNPIEDEGIRGKVIEIKELHRLGLPLFTKNIWVRIADHWDDTLENCFKLAYEITDAVRAFWTDTRIKYDVWQGALNSDNQRYRDFFGFDKKVRNEPIPIPW